MALSDAELAQRWHALLQGANFEVDTLKTLRRRLEEQLGNETDLSTRKEFLRAELQRFMEGGTLPGAATLSATPVATQTHEREEGGRIASTEPSPKSDSKRVKTLGRIDKPTTERRNAPSDDFTNVNDMERLGADWNGTGVPIEDESDDIEVGDQAANAGGSERGCLESNKQSKVSGGAYGLRAKRKMNYLSLLDNADDDTLADDDLVLETGSSFPGWEAPELLALAVGLPPRDLHDAEHLAVDALWQELEQSKQEQQWEVPSQAELGNCFLLGRNLCLELFYEGEGTASSVQEGTSGSCGTICVISGPPSRATAIETLIQRLPAKLVKSQLSCCAYAKLSAAVYNFLDELGFINSLRIGMSRQGDIVTTVHVVEQEVASTKEGKARLNQAVPVKMADDSALGTATRTGQADENEQDVFDFAVEFDMASAQHAPPPESTTRSEAESSNESVQVVIIGGGVAGLTAARHLGLHGITYTLLEARERLGGRVFTDHSTFSVPVDLGASLITGTKVDPEKQTRPDPSTLLCQQLGLKMHMLDGECPIYDGYDGEPVSLKLDHEVEGHFNQLLDAAMQRALEDMANGEEDRSLGHELYRLQKSHLSYFDAMTTERKDSENACRRRLLEWHLANLEYGCSAQLEKVSLAQWNQDDEYGGFGGPHCMIVGGYSQVVDALASGAVMNNCRLSSVVKRVAWDKEDVCEVTLENGHKIRAERVLVTIPLGCLKAGDITFEPELSHRKVESLGKLEFGFLNKVILEFPSVFWRDVNFFGVTQADNGPRGQCFLFWNIHKYAGAPILTALVAGKAAERLEEMSDEEAVEAAMSQLRRVYGDSIAEPIKYCVTRWGSDRFSRGAYSSVGVSASAIDYDLMAQPLSRRLFFAGEGTCKEHPDTVGGAILSGLREAVRIMQFLKGSSKGDAKRRAEAAGGFMALRSRSAYVPVAVTPRHDRLGSNKIRLKRKTRTGRTLLGKDVAHELSLPADPATRSEFQDFFKRISGSANKTIAIMQELYALNANSTKYEALRMLIQLPVSEGTKETMTKYEDMLLQILCYWVQSVSASGAGANELLLAVIHFLLSSSISKEKVRESRMLQLLNDLTPQQATPQVRAAIAEFRVWLKPALSMEKDAVLQQLLQQEQRELRTRQKREQELAAQVDQDELVVLAKHKAQAALEAAREAEKDARAVAKKMATAPKLRLPKIMDFNLYESKAEDRTAQRNQRHVSDKKTLSNPAAAVGDIPSKHEDARSEPTARQVLKRFIFDYFRERVDSNRLSKTAATRATDKTISLVCEQFREGKANPDIKSGYGERTILHDPTTWLARRSEKIQKYADSYARKYAKSR